MIWIVLGLIFLYYMGKFRNEELAQDRARGSVYVGRGYSIIIPEEPKPEITQPVKWPQFRRCNRQRKSR